MSSCSSISHAAEGHATRPELIQALADRYAALMTLLASRDEGFMREVAAVLTGERPIEKMTTAELLFLWDEWDFSDYLLAPHASEAAELRLEALRGSLGAK